MIRSTLASLIVTLTVVFCAAASRADDLDGAKHTAASNMKCYEKEKPEATSAMAISGIAVVGVRCGQAAWLAVVARAGSGWRFVGDALHRQPTVETNPLSFKGVAPGLARSAWSAWQRQGKGSFTSPASAADIAAARRAANAHPGDTVGFVKVVGPWALASINYAGGAGGGEVLLHRNESAWTRVAWGGGAMDPTLISAFGVPYDVARRLEPSDI